MLGEILLLFEITLNPAFQTLIYMCIIIIFIEDIFQSKNWKYLSEVINVKPYVAFQEIYRVL